MSLNTGIIIISYILLSIGVIWLWKSGVVRYLVVDDDNREKFYRAIFMFVLSAYIHSIANFQKSKTSSSNKTLFIANFTYLLIFTLMLFYASNKGLPEMQVTCLLLIFVNHIIMTISYYKK